MKNINGENSPILQSNKDFSWYILQVYAGNELSVVENIKHNIRIKKAEALFSDFYVAVAENTDEVGKKTKKAIYQGYIFIKMQLTEESWRIVVGTNRVVGFIGPDKLNPKPLSEEEYQVMITNILNMISGIGQESLSSLSVGDKVRVKTGSFESLTGLIGEVDTEGQKVAVTIKIFDRETVVSIGMDQVEKLS